MKTISKAIGGGVGAALAKTITFALSTAFPHMDEGTKQAIEYLVYTIVTGLAVYVAPANQPSN